MRQMTHFRQVDVGARFAGWGHTCRSPSLIGVVGQRLIESELPLGWGAGGAQDVWKPVRLPIECPAVML
jgi:hypothetical protein